VDLLIVNGIVYDPLNSVHGERMDVAVHKGKITGHVNRSEAKVIDASNMLIVPGGVDIHSHIAGPKVNAGRLLRPEDHVTDFEIKGAFTRSGVGGSVPSTFTTGYRYARMGYTTVMEPATPPIKTRHTHDELNDIPIIDKACYILFGNNWFVLEYLKDGRVEDCADYVSWVLDALKGYAIKVVNPGGVEAWGWGENVRGIDDAVPNFDITPREIIRGLCEVNTLLGLPHSVHLHTNNLGRPGNYQTTLETMKCVEDLGDGDPILHITHCQFSSFKGDDWTNLASAAPEISEYVNKHSHVTLDMGQIIFTETTTMTADGPHEYMIHGISGNKWVNLDIEAETGGGVVPYTYKAKSFVNATQWTIGLELALMIDDPWKIMLSTDHPNAGPFIEYPSIMSWLTSKHARQRSLGKVHKKTLRRSHLSDSDRELSLSELIVMTRCSPSKALGLDNKGHLGVGADADIAIFDINPMKVDASRDYLKYDRAFRRAEYTIKDGIVVARNGEITVRHTGKTLWIKSGLTQKSIGSLKDELRDRFKKYYTIQLDNYPIDESCLTNSKPIFTQSPLWS
jgi:formylmethanofuran dehydrogenase subunit A